MIFALTESLDCEGRRFGDKHYFYGKDKTDALNRYKEMFGSEWITCGFYSIYELSKEDGRIIIKKLKKQLKKAMLKKVVYSHYLDYLTENTSFENIKLEKETLKLHQKNIHKIIELEKLAKKVNLKKLS